MTVQYLPGMDVGILGRNDERVVRLFDELPEVRGAAAARPVDPLARAALVDAEAALDPFEPGAASGGLGHEGGHPVLRIRMVLFLEAPAVHGVRVRPLLCERHGDRAS